jgi:transcription termination factor NusB
MRVYMGIEKYEDKIYADLKNFLDRLVQNGLFHPDTVMEYPTVLQTSLNKNTTASAKNQSYAKKLFDESAELLKSSKSARDTEAGKFNETYTFGCVTFYQLIMYFSVLYIFPSLVSMFVQSYRKKRNALSMSNSLANTSSLDIGRTVEFGFFQAIYNILTPQIGKSKASLEVLNRLFQNLLDMNVYHATNDAVAKDQHAFLSEVTAQVFKQLEEPAYQGSVLKGISLLLEIDDTLIEPYMSSLWPYMLDPVEVAEKESYVLAKGILNTYAKSRQIGEYIQSLMAALSEYGEDKNEYFLRKPIFSRAFLMEFSTCVHNNVPPSQALSIFQIFYGHLMTEDDVQQPTKKRKLSKEMSTSNEYSHRLSIEFLCQFLLSIRLSPQQSSSFTMCLQQTSEAFIMKRLTSDNPRLVLPALQLHKALLTAFSDLYFDLLDVATKDKFVTAIQQIIADTSEHSTNLALTTLVSATNAALQFSYYSLLRDFKPSSTSIEDVINSLLSILLPKLSKNSIWNGRLIDLNANNIGTACWKVLAEDWLPTISTLARSEHMSQITSMISADDHTDQQISQHWSIHGINVNILRSAEFYELGHLRGICYFN